MDFEKRLRDEFQKTAEMMQPSSNLQKRVEASFEIYRQEKGKEKSSMKKKLLAGLVAAAILVPTGTLAGPTLVSKIVGTPEEAQKDIGMNSEWYSKFNESIEVAKQVLTKEEFEEFIVLLKEDYEHLKKISIVEDGERRTASERINPDDEKQTTERIEKLNKYWAKIQEKFNYTIEEVKKVVNFPVQSPTYIPDDYKLEEESVLTEITTGKPKPIIKMEFKNSDAGSRKSNAEEGFTIQQSEIFSQKGTFYMNKPFDQFTQREPKFDKISTYTLEGYNVTLGEHQRGKVKGMKIIIPEKDGRSAYQIYINASILPKEELEKILLSMLK
ncbi:hypothetical protein CON64_23265 [Bacillus pseudomycoides]|nr:hypothetical protein CON64_23265 [Bacillus pseudomycoides]